MDMLEVAEIVPDVEEGVVNPVTMHEHAEDTRDGIPEHWDTKGGRPVVAV